MIESGQGRDTTRYWWGRLFVRSASVLAVALLVATVVTVIVQVTWLRTSLAEAAYAPSAELAEEISALTQSCARTRDLLVTHFGDASASTGLAAHFPDAVASETDLAEAKQALAAYETAIGKMKESMVRRFEEASEWLLASMDRKAEKIRDRIEQQHSAEAKDLQYRIDALRSQLGEHEHGIYGQLTPAEIRSREQIIDQAIDFFDYLGELTNSAEVQSRIDDALGSLGRMKDMLPEPTSESYRLGLVSKVAELRRRLDDLLKQGNKLEGEQLAERLAQLQSEVIQAVQMSWAAERDLERLRERVHAEVERAEAARNTRQHILRRGLVRVALTATGGLAGSFLLVVVADVLRALFDAAVWIGGMQEQMSTADQNARSG